MIVLSVQQFEVVGGKMHTYSQRFSERFFDKFGTLTWTSTSKAMPILFCFCYVNILSLVTGNAF